MQRLTVLTAVACIVILTAVGVSARSDSWEFSGIEKIRLDGVSGDIIIRPADGNKLVIELRSEVEPVESFRGEVEQSGKTVRIDEDWSGRNSSGEVQWTILLPKGRDVYSVQASTASGDLDCRDVTVRLDFETASGDIELNNVDLADGSDFSTASGDVVLTDMTVEKDTEFSTASGDVDLSNLKIGEDCEFSTASGDVEVKDCICMDDVEFSSASGDVVVKNVELKGEGSFSSASGDVSVTLDKLPEHDLVASSASGDVKFEAGDFGNDFKLVMIKRKDRGRISCPFKYTDEDEFENQHVYEVKIVEKGSGKPEIKLRTASGKVTVKD